MERIRSDLIVLRDRVFDGYIYFENGKITEISEKEYPVLREYDLMGYYVSAGFIDIHTHGGGGNAFEGSVDEIVDGCNFHLKHGTTSICPTVSAAEIGSMEKSLQNIEKIIMIMMKEN